MSFHKSSAILDHLVDQSPLAEQAAGNTASNDQKGLVHGIMNISEPVIGTKLERTNNFSSSTSTISKPKSNVCPRCAKPVYFAEEVKAAGQSFHKLCYRCANCKKSINGASYSEHVGELYDNNCYQRLFGPKGVGYGIGAGALSTGT